MDAVTPKPQKSAEEHSHVVRPADMEWQQTRFPGCEVKTLLFDRASGLVTALMRCAPGAVLPDHEHVKIEQTYMLEGKLIDKEGPAAGLEVKAFDAFPNSGDAEGLTVCIWRLGEERQAQGSSR